MALFVWMVASVVLRDALAGLFSPGVSVAVAGVASLLVVARGRGWAVAGAGLGLWAAADALTLATGATGITAQPAFRLVYLLALALLAAGLLAVLVARRPAELGWVRRDALTTGLAVAALLTWLGLEPIHQVLDPSAPALVSLLHHAVVAGDMLLLVVAIMGFAVLRWRADLSWGLVTLAAAALLVAEIGFALQVASGTWSPLSPTNAGWSASSVLFACAAWSARPAARTQTAEPGLRDVVLPVVFSLACAGLLVADRWLDVGTVSHALATGALLTALSRLVATAVEHGALLRASRHEARTDPLTGLGNRRRLSDDLEAALATRAEPTALMLFDLDGFKRFNDRHGHPAGDALLVALGGELAAHVGADRAYRLGGDEFCALVTAPSGSLDLAVANAAATLRGAAERANIGASAGAVILGDEATSASGALRIADERLYGDKFARRPAPHAA